jgi:proteasome lid subunit RPN8/RPN11
MEKESVDLFRLQRSKILVSILARINNIMTATQPILEPIIKILYVFLRKKDTERSKGKDRYLTITRSVADGIISYAKACHPNEGILILQGKTKRSHIIVDGLVIPPFASHGPYFSGFPSYELPSDLSYIGTAHSHPGGSNRPSLEDLNNFYGFVSVIISYPYHEIDIGAFDRNGKNLQFEIV